MPITLDTAHHKAILDAINAAELKTSGEVKVHIENHLKDGKNVLDRAVEVFNKLGMDKTAERNGILFYIAIKDKQFAVIGDSGIHAKVGDEFWQTVRTEVEVQFRQGNFVEGLVSGINHAGIELSKYFPYNENDTDELSNDISFDDN